MGLDAVELVIAIEETFGIDLPDADVANLTTPRKLIDYVCARVGATGREHCASQRSFYRVRRILASAMNVSARAIRPGTHLDALLPRTNRKTLWSRVARELGVRRKLTRPRWIIQGAFALCLVTFVLAAISVPRYHAVVGAVAALLSGAVLAFVTEPMAVRLDVTAGVLAREAIPGTVLSDGADGKGGTWTREAVAETCRHLIREQLGLDGFSDDAEFIRDLGMD